jgi:hypothetical protein
MPFVFVAQLLLYLEGDSLMYASVRRLGYFIFLAALLVAVFTTPAFAQDDQGEIFIPFVSAGNTNATALQTTGNGQGSAPGQQLKLITIAADSPGAVNKLIAMGLDIAAVREGSPTTGPRGIETKTYTVEAVVSRPQAQKLTEAGFGWADVPGRGPAKKIGTPYNVYHSFDEPVNGIRAQLQKLAASYPHIVKLSSIGQTIQKRPLLAVKITNEKARGDKPQVLYVATHHAREWVATEMAMRLIRYLVSNYGHEARITNLLDTTEIWVVPVGNPDGYQYSFTNERLWRKNLRDNNGDGQISLVDGVDINRNFDGHWAQDNEGSSDNPADLTYRGPAPESEPETKALANFIRAHNFKFALSYHTYSNLILYPWGWQVRTPSLDDPIFVAQAGTDDNPAIHDSLIGAGYDPGVGADLYTTNGEFTDWAYGALDVPAYTVELTPGFDADGNLYGFEFPDDEAMVQTVFEDNLEFALALAESAGDPAHPVSPVGIITEDVYHTPLAGSYGPNQIVEVLARKGLNLSLAYSINGGAPQSAAFAEKLGETYNEETGIYYSKYAAVIGGQQAGDSVTYQVSGGASNLGPYAYSVTRATGNPILLVAAEDYSGGNPVYADPTQPNYLAYYTAALDAGGYAYDVWDVDTQGIPTYPEVLSHYATVIWYTGDDFAARVPLNLDTQEVEVLKFRDFLNYEDGKIFATGQDLAWLATAFGYYPDDFFQYYLGAMLDFDTGGIDTASGLPFAVNGESGDPVLGGASFALHGGDGANNQCCSSTFLPTGYFLPNYATSLAARYVRTGGPFDPHSGNFYVYSQVADLSYKRLGSTFTVPTDDPALRFWISYDTETDWDYAFVEVSPAGSGQWTTLPDANGLTTTSTGDSCPEGWVAEIHTFLGNYMDAACNPTGATGSWNAFTGNSSGWRQVEIDLTPYAGQTVELYISYATDWGTQGLGVFVDDIQIGAGAVEDFETGLGQWTVTAVEPSGALNNWLRITGAGFPEGPVIRTADTVYFGFGFEAIDTQANRNAVIDRVLQYLGQ